ncbi:MAG: hypothetical protein WBP88_09320 [Nitrososphaeraceae archaeon]
MLKNKSYLQKALTHDIRFFLLMTGTRFFINTVDKSQIWNPKLRPTFGTHYWNIAKYLYVEDELKRLTKNVCGKLTSSG